MPLRFPNARLFIHNLLADGKLSGAEAIALSACEFGLLDVSQSQLMKRTLRNGSCHCMDAAKQVLMTYFNECVAIKLRKGVDANQIWSALEKDARTYEEMSSSPARSGVAVACHDCTKFAPALFDLMLQHIRHYS